MPLAAASGEATDGEEITNEIPAIRDYARDAAPLPQMCPIHRDFKHFARAKAINFEGLLQGLVNHARQAVVNHAGRRRVIERRLTSLFKRIARALWQALTHRPGNIIPAGRPKP
jgi:hypothetical protein